ncbi:hypothetical protein Tco_0595266 [Tanacetum coccineum]
MSGGECFDKMWSSLSLECKGQKVYVKKGLKMKNEDDEDKDEIKGLISVNNHIANKKEENGQIRKYYDRRYIITELPQMILDFPVGAIYHYNDLRTIPTQMCITSNTIARSYSRSLLPTKARHEQSTESDHTWQPYKDENPFGRYHPEVRGGYRDDSLQCTGMKVEIPKFSGKVHPDDFINRLSIVEHVFDLKDIPEHLKVKLVAIRLRKHASLWWYHVKMQRALAGKSKVVTWEKMKIS